MAKTNQSPTFLAAGQKRANFVIGANAGDDVQINKGILSTEPRFEDKVEIVEPKKRTCKRITPKQDQLLVQRREPENLSAGGLLIIPEENKDKPAEGTVLSIGPLVTGIKEGDHIIFGKYSGTEFPFGPEVLLFMREDEVIATIEE